MTIAQPGEDGLEAKFSMEFALAAAVIARRVGLIEFTDAFAGRADVIDLMKRVKRTIMAEKLRGMPFAPAYPAGHG